MKITSRQALAIGVLLGAASWSAAALAQTGAASPEATIRALEQQQCQAALAGDATTLKRIFAADYQMVNPAGQLTTRAQLLALLTGPTHPYRSARYTTDLVRNLGKVMVTIGRETQVWVRQHGTWRLSVRQAMVIPPA
jgi:hypothetical protein